ncbi:hypothetical protein [Erythrobacter sp. HL-111]|uniref:hypothetical protein n=1 Tax=Erythrobacter sp. HL-111 TaxID=1798193 RepID=UPI0006D9FC6A|nr:hypothetical protein [Erythrobacter sp. HL-111]KPP89777.1 MAG: protein of unknown function DUF3121 [Erythrobacteraceae bacterium HL-111]SDT10229.1 hypothetical protein SAMN04515621_2914 [Erythrobacter sp. HL-111]
MTTFPRLRPLAVLAAALLAAPLASLHAQDEPRARDRIADSPLVGTLAACREIAEDAERLACFDRAAGALVDAAEGGEVKVVETEEITEARRALFGFSVPRGGILAVDEDEEEEADRLVSTVARVQQAGRNEWFIWIADGGAMWRLKSNSIRFRAPEVGDTVEFKPAAMGTFWVSFNGRKGVRGSRVE